MNEERPRWAILAMAGALAAQPGAPAWAGADDRPPEALVRWGNAIKAAYPHYASVTGGFEREGAIGGRCLAPGEPTPPSARHSISEAARAARAADPAGAERACVAALIPAPLLQVKLEPKDQRVFAHLVLRVAGEEGGPDAKAKLDALLDHGPLTNRSEQALIPIGPFVVEVAAPCSVGGGFAYDLYDVILAIQAARPDLAPPSAVAYSPCATHGYRWMSVGEVQASAAQPRELWGLDMPEAREDARKRAALPAGPL
jgi:hypothetical protein